MCRLAVSVVLPFSATGGEGGPECGDWTFGSLFIPLSVVTPAVLCCLCRKAPGVFCFSLAGTGGGEGGEEGGAAQGSSGEPGEGWVAGYNCTGNHGGFHGLGGPMGRGMFGCA